MDDSLIDVAGWLGAMLLLGAYALVSARRIEGDTLSYQCMNLAGGALLILNSAYYGAFPSVSVNVVWVAIAVLAIGRRIKG